MPEQEFGPILTPPKIILVTDNSQAGEARRQASQIATEAGFDATDCGKAAIIASELATNLSRYASGGEVHFVLHPGAQSLLDIISIDRGPGMTDVSRCLTDGYSTGGTSGNGLGAVRRLADEFDLYSIPGQGTVVFSRLNSGAKASRIGRFQFGTIARPAPGETVSGDACSIADSDHRLSIMMVDGLGHGPEAASAAAEAVQVFQDDPFRPLPQMFDVSHLRMQGTRGGAMAAAQIDCDVSKVHYVGIGNIAGHLRSVSDSSGKGLVSHNGTLGVRVRHTQEFAYDCPRDGLLIMHSDGLQSRWTLENYSGLAMRHPAIVAATLYRDYTRGRDDVTVAAIRISSLKQADHDAA